MQLPGIRYASSAVQLSVSDGCLSQAQIQALYESHRRKRNEEQREKLLDPAFEGVVLDPILQKIADPEIEPGYIDPRHCLVFWARPPAHIRTLIAQVQQKLLTAAPSTSRLSWDGDAGADTTGKIFG